jgi:hypothetical protein
VRAGPLPSRAAAFFLVSAYPDPMRISVGCLFLAALAAAGCKKESANGAGGMGGQPIAAASTDPLWALAPPDLKVGAVVADGALEPLYSGALVALAALEKAPGGAQVAGEIRSKAKTPVGDVLDRATLDALGIDLKKGMAFFESESVKIGVLPVGDPAKFAAKLGAPIDKGVVQLGPMTCKDVSGRFVCADSPAALDSAGKAGGASPVASWPRELRGHVEVFVSAAQMKDNDIPLDEPGGLRASAVLERGALTARVHMPGKPAGPLVAAKSGKSSLTAGVADLQPTGLFLINMTGLWKMAQAKAAGEPARPLPGGVTTTDLVGAPSGEVIGYALPGTPLRGIAKVGLSNADPVKKLIAACGEFAAMAPPGVTVKKNGEKCSVSLDPAALGAPSPAFGTISVDAWVESGALVIGAGEYGAKTSARPGLSPFAKIILDGSWLMAAWGQGTIAGAALGAEVAQMQAAIAAEPMAGLGIWAIYHLSEFGVAGRVADDGIHGLLRVRTLWANPDEVVSAVEEKIAAFAAGDAGAAAAIAEVAKKHPGSPFARDVEAGAGGLMSPVAVAGIIAAVSIPAFMKYKKKSESSEARAHLMKLASGAQMAWMDSSAPGQINPGPPALPGPSAGPTPPLGTCCQQGGRCQPNAVLWAEDPWKTLKFSMDDPHLYSYEYKLDPDGRSFTVMAYGDLDCDGAYSTFSMKGNAEAGGLPDITSLNETE